MENITNKPRYLILDTESGSCHSTSTLLTAYFMVTDDNFKVLGDLYLQLKPEPNEHYIVNAQGLGVNGINLVEHDKVSITCKQAKTLLYDFLKKHGSIDRLVPVGHATKGDIKRICDNLISEGSWAQFCTYHFIDTSVVLQFLRVCGKMPMDTDGSVESLATYFANMDDNVNDKVVNLLLDGNLHDARIDVKLTALIFQQMIEVGNSQNTHNLKG